jgi:hypothetical protein
MFCGAALYANAIDSATTGENETRNSLRERIFDFWMTSGEPSALPRFHLRTSNTHHTVGEINEIQTFVARRILQSVHPELDDPVRVSPAMYVRMDLGL